jgi:NO-binding membrane sensor protein with MHYT domain
METQASGRSKRQTSHEFYKKLFKLTIGGGVAFWAITIALSLLPMMAEFRAALSIPYVEGALVEPLLGGLIIGCCISYFLLRSFDKIPTKNPILKSVILSFVALGIVFILLGVAASRTSDALHIFLIGVTFNIPRFLVLGTVIGYLYKRLYGSA